MDAYGADAWRCFFAQYAHAHVATPALFHEYLYDSANLGFDGAVGANFSDFRARMEASFIGGVAAGAAPSATAASGAEAGAGAADGAAAVAGGATGSDGDGGSAGSAGAVETYAGLTPYPGAVERALLAASAGRVPATAPTPGRAAEPDGPLGATLLARATGEAGSAAAAAVVFAPACQLHEIIDGPLFTSSHIGGVRFVDLLAGWYGGAATPTVIDAHRGLRPPSECGADTAAAGAAGAPPSPPPSPPSPPSPRGMTLNVPAGNGSGDASEARQLPVAAAPVGPASEGGQPWGGADAPALAVGSAGAPKPAEQLLVLVRIEGMVF
jgi:hypothetical protein